MSGERGHHTSVHRCNGSIVIHSLWTPLWHWITLSQKYASVTSNRSWYDLATERFLGPLPTAHGLLYASLATDAPSHIFCCQIGASTGVRIQITKSSRKAMMLIARGREKSQMRFSLFESQAGIPQTTREETV